MSIEIKVRIVVQRSSSRDLPVPASFLNLGLLAANTFLARLSRTHVATVTAVAALRAGGGDLPYDLLLFQRTYSEGWQLCFPAMVPLVVPPAENMRRATSSEVGSLVKANGNSPDPGVPKARRISGGSDSDLLMPKAIYPDEAKRAGVTGTVAVKVTLDPEGRVIAAQAISGHPMLRASAEEAALKARLSPGPKTQSKRSAVISFTFSLLE